jgi:hypothetical protein
MVPMLDRSFGAELDGWSHHRYVKMKRTYRLLGHVESSSDEEVGP